MVQDGLTYTYQVQAVVSYEEQTDESIAVSATPSGQVTNLTAVQAATGIQLNWCAPEGAESFNISRGRGPGQEEAEPVGSSATNSYIDSEAAQGITYYYYVTALDGGDYEGDPSNEASAASVKPPSGLNDIPGSMGVLFYWQPQTGAQSYNIYRDGYGCATTSCDFGFDTGLGYYNWYNPPVEGSTHQYTCTAVINGHESLPSAAVAVPWVSDAIALHAEPEVGAVALAWTAWNGDTYQVWRQEGNATPIMLGTAIAQGGGGYPAQTIDQNASDRPYTYVIKGMLDGQFAIASNPATVTPGGPPLVWDAGTPICHALINGEDVENGRMMAPQDQRQSPGIPQQVTCMPNGSLPCEVEAATDNDHWTQGTASGCEPDGVTYTWSCLYGTFNGGGSTASGRFATYTAPATGCNEVITCTISDGRAKSDPRYDVPMVRQVQVIVPSVQILVRRCGSGNAFSNTCTIAAGGCDSAEQKADVRIQLTPAIAGIPVNIPQITGGQGVRVGSASNDAKIVLNDSYISYMEDETDGQYVTDAFGRVEGTYWGSNVVTGATSASPDVVLSPAGSAAGNIVTIHQAWDDADIWDPDTSDFGTVSFHPQITESGAAVHITGHQIEFAVAKAHVWRLDDAGSSYVPYLYTTDALDTSSDPGTVIISDPDLSRYHLATLDPTVAGDTGEGTYITNVDGPATATEVVDELELEGIDETVWTHQ